METQFSPLICFVGDAVNWPRDLALQKRGGAVATERFWDGLNLATLEDFAMDDVKARESKEFDILRCSRCDITRARML